MEENMTIKQWNNLKAKHPDAILLFRCGDFYETYHDDARVCAKILGITLTFHGEDKMPMAGFPHHALDKYLPMLISKGKRVAICDQLEDPKQVKNNNNQNSTTMTQNFKAADLIGKVIIVGNNQGKFIVKSVQDNGMLACDFSKAGETTTTSMTVTMPNLQKMQERGLWKISDSESATVIGGVVVATEEHHDITTEADVDEVEDIAPKVTKKPAPVEQEPDPDAVGELVYEEPTAKVEPIGNPKQEKPKRKSSRKFDLEKDKPKQQPKAENSETKGGKYVYATYKTSKGKTGAKITGFASEDDVFYANAADIHASGSYERDKDGNKLYYLCFGPRYAAAAKEVCKAMNDGKKFEDCKAIVDKATDDRIAQREEWKQRRSERAANAEPKDGYSKEDVAAMLRQVLAGGDVPEDIKKLLQAA